MDYHKFYEENDMFREYVDKYSKTYGITVMDALKHSLPQFVAEFINHREKETVKVE